MKIPKNADKFLSQVVMQAVLRGECKERIEIPRNADKIIDKEWKKFQLKAIKLLQDENYAKDLERLNNASAYGEYELIAKEIKNKYSISMPYPLDYLKSVKEAKQPLRTADGRIDLPDIGGGRIVKCVNADIRRNDATGKYEIDIDEGKGVREGYLYFRIKCDEPRYLIHYLIDWQLNRIARPKERFREERLTAFQVWEERKLRKPFRQIAQELNIKEPAAKKQFYRAYEITYGRKYNPADYEKPKLKKEYLKRTCKTCTEKPTCKNLCPDVISFVEQENMGYLREKGMTQNHHDITHFGERMDTD